MYGVNRKMFTVLQLDLAGWMEGQLCIEMGFRRILRLFCCLLLNRKFLDWMFAVYNLGRQCTGQSDRTMQCNGGAMLVMLLCCQISCITSHAIGIITGTSQKVKYLQLETEDFKDTRKSFMFDTILDGLICIYITSVNAMWTGPFIGSVIDQISVHLKGPWW